jgi:protein SCO1/2
MKAWIIACILVCSALAGCGQRPAPAFNGIDITGAPYGQNFRLLDVGGQTRTLADYGGKVVLLFFGFAQCPDICPTNLARLAEVMKRLDADADKVQVLFVTVDPERDTPAVLKEYTAAFDARFAALYTTPEETRKTAEHFKAFYQKVPLTNSALGYTIDHTALTYAFDPQGRLRLALRDTLTVEQTVADINRLLRVSP